VTSHIPTTLMFKVNAQPFPEVVIAAGALKSLPQRVKSFGTHAFIVTDPGVAGAGILKKVEDLLQKANIDFVSYAEVPANPSMASVQAGIDKMDGKYDGCVVISLGGGSAMDAAKAMAVIGPDGGRDNISSYCFYPQLTEKQEMDFGTLFPKTAAKGDGLPIICIPTTSGTASETNGSAVLTDTANQRKLIYTDSKAMAKLSLLDPELTLKLPRYPTATCGMDALTHALEAYTAKKENPYSDAIAYGVIETVAKWLPILMNDLSNLEARLQIQVASHMAGVAFSISGLGLCHAVGHPLSAILHQAHGQTLATMLPHVMEFNLPHRKSKYAKVAKAFGVFDEAKSDEDNARAAMDAIAKLSIQVGTAKSITQMGGGEDNIPQLVEQALLDVTSLMNCVPATPDDIAQLYKKALHNSELYPMQSQAKL